MIKLLAVDLDGTLFYPKRKIRIMTSKNRKFLTSFTKNGGHLVVVSGRNYQTAKMIGKKIGHKVDMIACNGSVVVKNEEIQSDSPMSKELILEFLKENKDNKNPIAWCFMSDRYPMVIVPLNPNPIIGFIVRVGMRLQFKYCENFVYGKKHLLKLLDDKDVRIYKMMAIYGFGESKKELARQETLKYLDAYGTKFEVLWSNESVEFMNKGVNKANALKTFINVLNLKDEEIAVVGDSGNDIPLFETFSNSFVMAQAPEEVKSKAKTIIKGVYCVEDYIK